MPEQLSHAILGVGGVGGLIGASLARCGAPVTLVLRRETLANYPEQLTLESAFGNVSVNVATAAKVPPVDVLWIAVKAPELEAALESFANPDSVRALVPLLNGIDHLAFLRSRYGDGKVIAATIAVESERVAPGHIIHRSPFANLNVSSAGETLLGGTIAQLQQLGFHCKFIDHEGTLMWSKLVFLAAFALTTTAGDMTTGEVLADPTWRQLGMSCIQEGAAVAAAEGAKLQLDSMMAAVLKMPPNMRSSMQKDVEQGKIPELDAIAGPILRGAQRHAIAVPAVTKLVALVEQRAGLTSSLV